MALSLN